MLRKAIALTGAVLCAACASQPPVADPEPLPPVLLAAPVTSETVDEAVLPPPPPAAPPRPQQTDAGRFRVSVAAADSTESAARWVRKVEAAGYRSEVLPVQIEGKTWQRVLLPGCASLEEARAAIPFVEHDLGVQGAWVTSRRRAPTPAQAAEAQPQN